MKQNAKILVVDDSDFMRQYISSFLSEGGFKNIIEASNGREAVQKFQEEKPDVILMDLIMPVEDGSEALEKLVKLDAKVIVVSAIGQKSIIEQTLGKGARGYFVKPFFTSKEIADKINQIL